jgi:hypothetical protein
VSSPSDDHANPSADPPIALPWSNGKASALALWTLRKQGQTRRSLITTVTNAYDELEERAPPIKGGSRITIGVVRRFALRA